MEAWPRTVFMNCRESAGGWMDRLMRGRRRLAGTEMVTGQDENHEPVGWKRAK